MIIENQTFDEERALYGLKDLTVKNCRFDGPADGESAFKECRNIDVTGYRCGYRVRRFDTRLGTVYLSVPKIRQAAGSAAVVGEG